MRRKLIFFLLSCLIGSGIPGASVAGDNHQKSKEGQRLTLGPMLALNTLDFENKGVLKQTAGSGQRPVDSPEWDKNKPGGGISEQAAAGIVLVGVAAIIIIFVTTAYGKGGS